jgi:dehydrogenase/reductase SDR family protein 7B
MHFAPKYRNKVSSYYSKKKIWITGASSGIGEQLALQLSATNAILILSARRKDELDRVRSMCKNPEDVYVVPLDLSVESSVREAFEIVKSTIGEVDILFNNGGISQRSTVLQTPLELERKMFEINFFSNILLSKLVASTMVERKYGHLVITSSLLGKWGFPLRSSYSASKHALHGYYESMRMELEQQGIFITLVTPGFVATEISLNSFNEKGNRTNEMDNNQATGLSAVDCAMKILQGVSDQKKEFAVGGKEVKGILVKRLFPSLFEKLLRRSPSR